jgi:hypothetical protein
MPERLPSIEATSCKKSACLDKNNILIQYLYFLHFKNCRKPCTAEICLIVYLILMKEIPPSPPPPPTIKDFADF